MSPGKNSFCTGTTSGSKPSSNARLDEAVLARALGGWFLFPIWLLLLLSDGGLRLSKRPRSPGELEEIVAGRFRTIFFFFRAQLLDYKKKKEEKIDKGQVLLQQPKARALLCFVAF